MALKFYYFVILEHFARNHNAYFISWAHEQKGHFWFAWILFSGQLKKNGKYELITRLFDEMFQIRPRNRLQTRIKKINSELTNQLKFTTRIICVLIYTRKFLLMRSPMSNKQMTRLHDVVISLQLPEFISFFSVI